MTPTEDLKREHEDILAMLDILQLVCERLEGEQEVAASHLELMVEFFKLFADRCHHGKVEDYLFPAMGAAGVPREGGPIGVMLMEHDRGRGASV